MARVITGYKTNRRGRRVPIYGTPEKSNINADTQASIDAAEQNESNSQINTATKANTAPASLSLIHI